VSANMRSAYTVMVTFVGGVGSLSRGTSGYGGGYLSGKRLAQCPYCGSKSYLALEAPWKFNRLYACKRCDKTFRKHDLLASPCVLYDRQSTHAKRIPLNVYVHWVPTRYCLCDTCWHSSCRMGQIIIFN
jgi:hypothetical protein